jgi:hypothetical protein
MDKKHLEQIETFFAAMPIGVKSTWDFACLSFSIVPELIAEIRALQSENARLCPVADLDTVTSLRAELQQCQEQVQTLERMLDAANQDARDLMKVIDDFAQPNAGDDPDAAGTIERHNARYHSEEVESQWRMALDFPESCGLYRVRVTYDRFSSGKDETVESYDPESGWSHGSEDEQQYEVVQWKELKRNGR